MKQRLYVVAAYLFGLASLVLLFNPMRIAASGIIQSAYNLIQDEGVSLSRRQILNCVGAGIACTDVGGKTVLTVAGGGGSGLPILPCVSMSGSDVAYTCITGSAIVLADRQLFSWKPDVTCGTMATLDIDANGAKPIVDTFTSPTPLPYCADAFTTVLLAYNSVLDSFVTVNALNGLFSECATTNGVLTFTGSPPFSVAQCSPNVIRASDVLLPLGLAGFAGSGPPTITGCSATIDASATNLAGFYTSGTTGACAVNIQFVGISYATGAICYVNNLSTPANVQRQSAFAVDSVDLTGTTVSGDQVAYFCLGF